MAGTETPQRRLLPPFARIGFFRARLGRLILLLNLAGLLVLITGALVLNEFRQGLIDNRRSLSGVFFGCRSKIRPP